MKYPSIPIIFLTTVITMPTLAVADDDDELELDEAQLYFELNDTDGDLGIHGKADGDAWKRMKIEAPNERTLLNINVRSRLRRQGLTELFFESSEPTFDELDPEVFFNRFPEGVYEWEGLTTEYEEIEGEVYLSQRIPAAPMISSVGAEVGEDGEPADECWDPGDVEEVIIEWAEVTETHAWLGSDTGAPLGDNKVIYYEFVVEIDGTEYKSTALIPPDETNWTVPEQFIELAEDTMVQVEDEDGEPVFDEDGNPVLEPVDEIKFEVIVRVETGEQEDDDGETIDSRPGNQSAVESCFDI